MWINIWTTLKITTNEESQQKAQRDPAGKGRHQTLPDVIQASLTVHEIQRYYLLFLITPGLCDRDGAHGRKAAARHTRARAQESSRLSMSALLIGIARTQQKEGRGRQGPLLLKRYIRSISAPSFYFALKVGLNSFWWILRTKRRNK